MNCAVCGVRTYKTKQPVQSHCTTCGFGRARIRGCRMKTLTPADTRIFDDDVLEDMQARWDDTPMCEAPRGCDKPAVARFTVLCRCPLSRLGCARHIKATVEWLQTPLTCKRCGQASVDYKVVPL